jgi:hypothetical protein
MQIESIAALTRGALDFLFMKAADILYLVLVFGRYIQPQQKK